MPKYIIERDVPGVGDLSAREQKAGALRSRRTVDELGPDIRWQHSDISGDKTYCIYIASDEEIIREHAERSGFPATEITEVRTLHDPTTAEMEVQRIALVLRDETLEDTEEYSDAMQSVRTHMAQRADHSWSRSI